MVIVIVVDVDVTTAAVVVFDATISRHKGFEGILRVVNITVTVATDMLLPRICPIGGTPLTNSPAWTFQRPSRKSLIPKPRRNPFRGP